MITTVISPITPVIPVICDCGTRRSTQKSTHEGSAGTVGNGTAGSSSQSPPDKGTFLPRSAGCSKKRGDRKYCNSSDYS